MKAIKLGRGSFRSTPSKKVVFCIVHQQRIDDLAHTQTVECETEEREVLVVR